jgi:hydrogenase/urease accessory protein HupE
MMLRLVALLLGLLPMLGFPPALGHDLNTGYVELTDRGNDRAELIRILPSGMESFPDLQVTLDPPCEAEGDPLMVSLGDRMKEAQLLHCQGGIAGRKLGVRGLGPAQLDLLARVVNAEGQAQTARLTVSASSLEIQQAPDAWDVAATYFGLGVEHILTGVDHLLFVLALILLVRGWHRLFATITAFTIAHSITLAAAVLGPFDVPRPPIEALIALSIALVAVEIVRRHEGRSGYTAERPWVAAFLFGLLHGLAFADALRSVGLPEGAIPVALLFFNLGVEAGQLAFIAAALPVLAALRRTAAGWPRWSWGLAPYAIGSMAMFWLFERVAAY